MAVTETWVLDGLTISGGNFTVLELNIDPPKDRADWISAADSEGATLLRTPLHENRKITFKLRVAQQASMDAALDQIGAVRDKLRKATLTSDGVTLTWTAANSARTTTFDVLDGEFPELPVALDGQAYSWFLQRPVFTLELTAKPYWRGTETLTSTASSSTPFVTIEVAGVTGDIPALGRLIVTDTATQNRRHVEWGLENQFYNSGVSLLIDSDSLTVSGFAGTQTTQTGAYDPNATGNNAISVTPTFYTLAMAGTGNQSHVGTFKVKARMWCPQVAATTVQSQGMVRLSWAAGGGVLSSNPWTAPTLGGRWEELDLGYITIPPAVIGSQRWVGQIEIRGFVDLTTGTATSAYLDYLLLVPAGEGYGRARAAFAYQPGVVIARDDFTGMTPGAALNARVAPAGGTWATTGSATDLVALTSFGSTGVSRSAVSDANTTSAGRFGLLGTTTYTDVEVDAIVVQTVPTANASSGVLARYTDTSNYLRFAVSGSGAAIDQIVAGTATRLAYAAFSTVGTVPVLLRLVVYASGRVIGIISNPAGTSTYLTLDGQSSVLATGGTLATGKVGIWDWNAGAEVTLRYYDAVGVSTPMAEPPVIASGRSLQVRYDDTIGLDSTGTYYGRPPSYRGSRFLLPPGTSRVLVKARRNDIEAQADDTVTDATQIQIGWTPRGLVVAR